MAETIPHPSEHPDYGQLDEEDEEYDFPDDDDDETEWEEDEEYDFDSEDDDGGYGPGSYFARAMNKDD